MIIKKSYKIIVQTIIVSYICTILLEIMLRTVYTPDSNTITFPIPQSWYGQEVEVIAFPVNEILNTQSTSASISRRMAENRKKREENNRKYSVSFSALGYKFNREEANNYDE